DSGAHTVSNWATNILAGPPDESGQAVNFIVSNNSNPGLFSVAPAISPSGTLTYTLANNVSGSATMNVQIHDNGGTANGGVDTSGAQQLTINVTFVNDVPSFTKGSDQTVLKNAGAQSVSNWATNISPGTGTNESGQTVHFNITNNTNAALF